MRKTVVLLALLVLLVPLSAFAAKAAGTADKPAQVASAGSLAPIPTSVGRAFDVKALFQASSKVENPSVFIWSGPGVCSSSCAECYGPRDCPRGDGYCTRSCL
jgi:hypothetical protein